MPEDQIENLMDTVMSNIKSMIDVNTIVGDAVETPEGNVIIPVSRVSFGFVAGGGEMQKKKEKQMNNKPFAGGSGAGITLNPIAFLIVKKDQVKLLPISNNAVVERLLNLAPDILKEIENIISGKKNRRNSEKNNLY